MAVNPKVSNDPATVNKQPVAPVHDSGFGKPNYPLPHLPSGRSK